MRYAMRKRYWPERLAGFFAAKEATRKAFGHAIPWRWVGVGHEPSGKPSIELFGKAERLPNAAASNDSPDDHAHGDDGRGSRDPGTMIYVLTPEQMRAADAAGPRARRRGRADARRREADRRARLRAMAAAGGRVVAFAGPGKQRRRRIRRARRTRPGVRSHRVRRTEREARRQAREAAMARARAAASTIRPLPATEAAARAALDGADRGRRAVRHGCAAADACTAIACLAARARRAPGTGACDRHPERRRRDDRRRRPTTPFVRRVTVTLGAAKPGLLLDPARDFVGELWYAPIGIDHAISGGAAAQLRRARRRRVRCDCSRCARPKRDKRAAGAPLIIAGFRAVPRRRRAVRAGGGARRRGLRDGRDAGRRRERLARASRRTSRRRDVRRRTARSRSSRAFSRSSQRNSSVAIGPGLGLDDRTGAIVTDFCARNRLPFVVDASALFHLSKQLDVLRGKAARRYAARRRVRAPLRERDDRARASAWRACASSSIAPASRRCSKAATRSIYDGATMHLNATGTNALATAGTGDVLTGIIATLRRTRLVDRRCGARRRLLARPRGSCALATHRPVGVVAGDVVDALAGALPHANSGRRAWPTFAGFFNGLQQLRGAARPDSSRMATPSCWALAYLLPGSSPATT